MLWGKTINAAPPRLYFLLLLLVWPFAILTIISVNQKSDTNYLCMPGRRCHHPVQSCFNQVGAYIHPQLPGPVRPAGGKHYIFFSMDRAHYDITMLGLPIIIAFGGLLLGKRSALVLAGLSIICFSGIFWAETHGLTPYTGNLVSYFTIDRSDRWDRSAGDNGCIHLLHHGQPVPQPWKAPGSMSTPSKKRMKTCNTILPSWNNAPNNC